MTLRLALLFALPTFTGAQDERWWALAPIERPEPPTVRDEDWCRTPIDRFVLARLEAARLEPAPEAGARELMRRMHLVLTGLPPAPEAAPLEHERLLDALLASPHYGERWARHWLDLARFAETNGFETNTPRPNAWPYRDWVVDALNADLPYDQFLHAQVAGDLIGQDAATGFLVAGAWDEVKSPDVVLSREQRQNELADIVNAVSTNFLGLTIACARCHDHKFDPLLQRDYYAVEAIFAGVQHGERPWRTALEAQRLGSAQSELEQAQRELAELAERTTPRAPTAGLVVIDDEDAGRARALRARGGHGEHAAGHARGERDDPGDPAREPNLGRGRYSWWHGEEEGDVYEVSPGLSGAQRIWISWGAGPQNHASDASWWLVQDGERVLLAEVDQRRFADGADCERLAPLWSGLLDTGVHELRPDARLVLRTGREGQPVTADAVAFAPAPCPPGPPTLRAGVSAAGNAERFAPTLAQAVRFTVHSTVGGAEPCIDELEVYADGVNHAPAAERVRSSGDYAGNPKHRIEHINDERYGNPRSWISNTRGAGWIELWFAAPIVIDELRWARDREGVYADRLARDYSIELLVADERWLRVAGGADRLPPGSTQPRARFADCPEPQRAAQLFARELELADELAGLQSAPQVYAGRFVEPEPTQLLHRGDVMQPLEAIAPDLPGVLGSLALAADVGEAARRDALGRWLGDPRNPLSARVCVNRLWAHHFGVGLVATPNDFGVMGAAPSHPQLLDWLASELVASGWSIKHLQRLIVSSSTWRQSTRHDTVAAAVDAEARLLWRFPPRRVEAEVLRDSILFASGSLDLTPGGPGYSAFEPNQNYVRNYVPRADFAPDGMRRMLYMTKVRMERDATFGVFDTPDAGQVCSRRERSTTPLQALALLNSPFVLDQAARLAARVEGEVGTELDAGVQRAFELVLGRAADSADLEAARPLVEAHGLAALARALFNCNEHLFLP